MALPNGVRPLAVLALLLAAVDEARAQSAPLSSEAVHPALQQGRRTMTALRLGDGDELTLDGVIDEPFWARVEPATDFVMQDPVLGGTPTEPTEVRIAFDRDNLYMGVTAHDSEPDRLLGNTMRRDETL